MELKNKWTLSGQVCTGAQVSTTCSVNARRVSHAHRNSTAGDTQTRHRDCIMYAYTESPRLGDHETGRRDTTTFEIHKSS